MAGDAVIVQGVVRGYAAGPPAVVTVELAVGGQYADVAAASHYKQWSAWYCGGESFDTIA